MDAAWAAGYWGAKKRFCRAPWTSVTPCPAGGSTRPDVEIVGAGITGISAALTLAEAGQRVRIHDAREVAGGASGRNGGFALRGGAMPYDQAREWLGRTHGSTGG